MFYGIKSSAFLLHETKPGVLAPATRVPAHTPSFFFFFFFFLHNSLRSSERQLTLLILERRRGREITHSSSCWGNTARETEPQWETRQVRPPDIEERDAKGGWWQLHSNLIGSNKPGREDMLETPIYQDLICAVTCFSRKKIIRAVWGEMQFKTNN